MRAAPRPEQAERDTGFAEGGVGRCDPQVGREGEFHAATSGRAVNARDDSRRSLRDGTHRRLAVFRKGLGVAAVGEARHLLEVSAGAERRPRTAEKDNGKLCLDSHGEVVEHSGRQGVAPLWAVQRHRPDAASGVVVHANHRTTPRRQGVSKGLCPCPSYRPAMDDAVRARDAARSALDDVEPADLRGAIDDRLADASMLPAVLTLVCARAVAPDEATTPGVVERAVGVQLIYEGLALTRRLVAEEPWANANGAPESDIVADLQILAADVLVSRGFYLLATTEAADRAVSVIRAFGRDQTTRAEGYERELEADVCALAGVAGATVGGDAAPDPLVDHLERLGRGFGGRLPPVDSALDSATGDRVSALAAGDLPADVDSESDRLARSTGDT